MLTAIKGPKNDVNNTLMNYATKIAPVLIIDCANWADPHTFVFTPPETLQKIYVMQAEIIYKLRDILKQLNGLKLNKILVTTFSLFDYGDDKENHDLFEHSWQLLQKLSARHEIFVGVDLNQYKYAEKYSDKITKIGSIID